MSRANANPTGSPHGAVDVTSAPTVHTGRALRVPARLGEAGRDVWRAVWDCRRRRHVVTAARYPTTVRRS